MSSFVDSSVSCLRNVCALCVSALSLVIALHSAPVNHAGPKPGATVGMGQAQKDADGKSSGCVSCHASTDEPTMHPTKTVHLDCTDCHGGNSSETIGAGVAPN